MSQSERHPGPFFHAGGRTGILMLHGFTGSAYVFEQLARSLNAEGHTTYACLLRGHGTSHEDMEKTAAQDWVDSAAEAYDRLAETCDRIYAIGVSFGGLIAADLSLYRPLAGIVMIGAPLRLERQAAMGIMAFLFPLIGRRFYAKGSTKAGVSYYEKSGNDLGAGDSVFAGGNHSYRNIPARSVRQLLGYLRKASSRLRRVTAPALVFHSDNDGLVAGDSGERIMTLLGSAEKSLVVTSHPHHNLRALLAEPDVYGGIAAFVRR